MLRDATVTSLTSPKEAEQQACAPVLQLVKSSPQNTTLSFGDPHNASGSVVIGVQVLKATAQQRPMSQQKIVKATDNNEAKPQARIVAIRGQVEMRKEHYRVDDVVRAGDKLDESDALPEEWQETLTRAYKLGASIVPMSNVMEFLPDTQQGIEVLHFVHASTVRAHCIFLLIISTAANTASARPLS